MLTDAVAELLGLHAGDGTLYKTSRGVVWELRGNLEEKKFYDEHIVPLLAMITGASFVAARRSGGANGCYGVRASNREPVFLLQRYGFAPGRKCASVRIPVAVIEGSQTIKAAFLRGLFASDGTAYLARINARTERSYPMIEFCSRSQELRDDVVHALGEFGLSSAIWSHQPRRGGRCHYLRLAGREKTAAFALAIGLANPRHRRRLFNETLRKL